MPVTAVKIVQWHRKRSVELWKKLKSFSEFSAVALTRRDRVDARSKVNGLKFSEQKKL